MIIIAKAMTTNLMDEQHAAQLSKSLSENGYRITAARKAILEAFVACHGHITADDLVDRVHENAPKVGRMTVYRTLDIMCQLNLIHPVYQGTGAAHFVLLHNGHHHHLICSHCGKVIEFDECVVAELETAVSQKFGFTVQGHLVEFYGLCADCSD
ncbi:MAG: transcriptional repressor [Chloroflexi bacterium]|nr:MAG: transcriptional repressor [Chloroflexota bacterium]